MSTKTTKAEQLAERAKRTEAKATEAQARAEAERAKAEKLAAAAEAERVKQAEREIAEAAKEAEALRHEQATEDATLKLGAVVAAEVKGLVASVKAAWRLGEVIVSAGLKARPVAIAAMHPENWATKEEIAKENGKQAQPDYLSKVNDSVNVRKRFATEAEAVAGAEVWAAMDHPGSVSLRSFAKGENVNKPKRKGPPMTAKAAAGLFAKACEREGLTEDQAWALISEAMENVAE